MNLTFSGVPSISKNSQKMKLRVKFRAEDLHSLHIFERICCFDNVILMALISTEQLFIEKPL